MSRTPEHRADSAAASVRWPAIARLRAVPGALRRARLAAAPRRAAALTLAAQLALLACFAVVSAARPYEGLWLRLATATWLLWLWPLASAALAWARLPRGRVGRAGEIPRPVAAVAAVAEELDRLNPGAPDVFRTALHPEVHAPATRDALESLFARWEPGLRVPAAPRVFGRDRGGRARRFALGFAVLWGALAAAAPLLLPSSVLPGGPGAVVARMAEPWRVLGDIPAPRLSPRHVPAVMAQGDTLRVLVAVEHVPAGRPVHARVTRDRAGREAEIRYDLTDAPPAAFAGGPRAHGAEAAGPARPEVSISAPALRLFRFGPVTEDFTVRFTALDASTRTYEVKVVAPPRLKSFSAVVTPPAYARLPRDTLEVFPAGLTVLPGTRIAWSGAAERPLESWEARWEGQDETADEAFAQGGGDRIAFARVVSAAGSLRLSLIDRAAHGGGRGGEGPWRIGLREDRPPEVMFLSPAGDGELPRTLKVPILFRVTDDFGVSAVRLHYALRGAQGEVKAEGTRDVTAWRDARDGGGGGVWDGAARGVLPVVPEPGESVELFLEAEDNNAVSGPGRSRSATVRLKLPSLEEVREAIAGRERDASAGLASALERERRRQSEARRPDRAASADAATPAPPAEWEVRRVLSDEPRRHAQEVRRQLDAELNLAREAVRRSGARPQDSRAPGAKTIAALEELKRRAEELERRLPTPEVARAPIAAQQRALEALSRDQKALEQALAERPPPAFAEKQPPASGSKTERETRAPPRGESAEREAARAEARARENRLRLEEELQANRREQEALQGWLRDQERAQAAQQARAEAASRQEERMQEDVKGALEQLEEAMRAGIENGTITPDVLEKMDRIRELLADVLDEREKASLQREAGAEAPAAEDLQRALRQLTEEPDDLRRELERAIRMLETVRDVRALRDLTGDMRALEEEQRALAEAIGAERPESSRPEADPDQADRDEAAALAARQEALAQRLDKALHDMEQLAAKPSLKPLGKESVQSPPRAARADMKRAGDHLKKQRPDRKQGRESANLAAQKLAAAAAEMESALAQVDKAANLAEMREVLEETLEFTRWLEGGGPGGLARSLSLDDAQAVARVAKWLAGRMEKLAAVRAFDSDVLRRAAASMATHADALSTKGASESMGQVRRHARGGARELLKWLSESQSGGGSQEGEGQGDNEFGGGDQGESDQEGSQGLAGRMRGVSGKQMAANRMTQDLLRSLMEERRPDGGGASGGGQPGGTPGGKAGGAGSGSRNGEGGGGQRTGSSSGQGAGQGGGGEGGRSGEGGPPGAAGSAPDGDAPGARGGAANAQQEVADMLESMAERADDAGGAARALRRLAEEARALERALRGDRLEPAEIRKRQEQFRTRLLESADAMEERGRQRERRAEAWTGGPGLDPGRSLPMDSLAAELKRRRENARRLPLTPEQKRRVEWYYERLLAE